MDEYHYGSEKKEDPTQQNFIYTFASRPVLIPLNTSAMARPVVVIAANAQCAKIDLLWLHKTPLTVMLKLAEMGPS